MSLHLSPVAEAKPTPKLVRLPASMLASIREYAAAKAAKKKAESDARAADNVIKSLRSSIDAAMGDSITAVCEHVTLARKKTADAAPSITMNDGSKIDWALVSGLTVGNRYIAAESVKSVYGGRSGSEDIDCTGV